MRYLRSGWARAGIAIAIVGWTPLFSIAALAALGWWPDPDPNPIGPGLLFFVTFWPAIICLAVGAYRTWVRQRT
jgi:hypothetical protein